MADVLQYRSVLLAIAALVPGAVIWWSARTLRANPGDPMLPERLQAHQRRAGILFVAIFAGLATMSPRSLYWTATLEYLGACAAAYPLRRALFEETWGFGAYLSFMSRSVVAMFGFWALLSATPALIGVAGSYAVVLAGTLAIVLVLWNAHHPDILRLCLRTQPLADGPLLTRCRDLAARCQLTPPRFERIPLGGGVFANAFALPSRRTSSVLFTETLLDRLDENEIVAICAHELAHLEHYTPDRLRRLNLITLAMILGSLLATAAARLAGVGGSATMALWLCAVAGALALFARGKQQQETVCDARAVALIGDPDPLIRALTKLYVTGKIPRRVELHQEQSDTHPSLSRRIRSIRRAGGRTPDGLTAPVEFVAADGTVRITFDRGVLQWTGADAITRVEYGRLCELRIDARRPGRPRLIARGTQGSRWEMALAPADLARLQAVLDAVDGSLAEAVPEPQRSLSLARPTLAVAAFLAVMAGQFSVALTLALSVVRVARPLLVGSAIAALTATMLLLQNGQERALLSAALTVVLAATAIGLAWVHRHEVPARTWPLTAMLGAFATLATASLTLTGIDVVRLHQAARTTPSAVVLSAAFAGALVSSRKRLPRAAGIAIAAAALGVGIIGTPMALDRLSDDPLLVESPAVAWRTTGATALDEFAVPPATSSIRLSPDGRSIAALQASETEDDAQVFHVGRHDEALTPLTADELVFVDDGHVLVSATDRTGTTLREVRLNSTRDVVWTHRVDGMVAPRLTIAAQRWRLAGWDGDNGLMQADGVIGTTRMELNRWPLDRSGQQWVETFAASGRDALIAETRYDYGVLGPLTRVRWNVMTTLARPYSEELHFAKLEERGRTSLGHSRLGADCLPGVLAADVLVCMAFDGSRTRFVGIDLTGHVAGLGYLHGSFTSDRRITPGWLTGWSDSTAAAIDLSSGQAFRVIDRGRAVSQIAVAGDRLAAMTFGDNGPAVRIYALHPPALDARR